MSDYDPRAHGAKCDACPLAGKKVVPSMPNPKARLVVVGEAPGRVETAHGRPFIGPGGLLLDKLMTEASFGNWRQESHVTNALLCRPDSEEELKAGIRCCAPRLAKELSQIPAKAPILALWTPGGAATQPLLGIKNILKGRGFVWTVPSPPKAKAKNEAEAWLRIPRELLQGRTCLPTLHPAFLLRGAETWRPVVAVDVKRAVRWARLGPQRLASDGPFTIVKTAVALEKALRSFGKEALLDVETDGVDPMSCGLDMLGICDVGDPRRIVLAYPWKKSFARVVREFLKTRTAICHNGPAFDWLVLRRYGVPPECAARVDDSLIAHHAYASHLRQGLDHLGSVYTDSMPWKLYYRGKQVDEKGGMGVRAEDLPAYNAADVRINAMAWTAMQPDLLKERSVYEEDMKMAWVCHWMQWHGMLVDVARRDALASKMRHRRNALLGVMRATVKDPTFAPSRPADVRRAIYQLGHTRVWKLTPKGLPSTDKSVLNALVGKDTMAGRLAGEILRYRTAKDNEKEYLTNLVIGPDGRVHAGHRSFGTRSGRPASRRPNLYNTPRMGACKSCGVILIDGVSHKEKCKKASPAEPHKQIRDIYIAAPGWRYVYFDLSQAEMRFAAYLSGDPVFIESCGKDIHASNAAIMFPEMAEVIKADPKGAGKRYRDIAKNAGFAISYGAEAETVFAYVQAQGFKEITLRNVEIMLGYIKRAYRVYYAFVASNLAFVQKHGYLRTHFNGRIQWFGWHPKPTDVANYPIQGGVADVMNRAIPAISARLPASAKLLCYVYDSITIETPEADVDLVKRVISDFWAQPIKVPHNGLSFVQPVEIKSGERWSDFA